MMRMTVYELETISLYLFICLRMILTMFPPKGYEIRYSLFSHGRLNPTSQLLLANQGLLFDHPVCPSFCLNPNKFIIIYTYVSRTVTLTLSLSLPSDNDRADPWFFFFFFWPSNTPYINRYATDSFFTHRYTTNIIVQRMYQIFRVLLWTMKWKWFQFGSFFIEQNNNEEICRRSP